MDEFNSHPDPSDDSAGGAFSGREVAQYIHQMSAELSVMAEASGLFRLAAGLSVISAMCEVELAERGQS